jgi:hypothetical protein
MRIVGKTSSEHPEKKPIFVITKLYLSEAFLKARLIVVFLG